MRGLVGQFLFEVKLNQTKKSSVQVRKNIPIPSILRKISINVKIRETFGQTMSRLRLSLALRRGQGAIGEASNCHHCGPASPLVCFYLFFIFVLTDSVIDLSVNLSSFAGRVGSSSSSGVGTWAAQCRETERGRPGRRAGPRPLPRARRCEARRLVHGAWCARVQAPCRMGKLVRATARNARVRPSPVQTRTFFLLQVPGQPRRWPIWERM